VRTGNLHLTVLFLGEQNETGLRSLFGAIRDVCSRSMALQLRVGTPSLFGPPPRVLFLECHDTGTDTYKSFALRVRDGVAGCGLVLQDSVLRQEPLPHLTLVRFRDPQEARSLARHGRFVRGSWVWDDAPALPAPPATLWELARLGLYCSVLRPAGPEYECLDEFPLGGKEV